MTGMFDENDKESWYFEGLSFDETRKLLIQEEVGVFLVRDSSRGGFVLCVKELSDVAQYPIKTVATESETKFIIRDELSFRDLPSLLSFYKRNLFESTALVRPIRKDNVPRQRHTLLPVTNQSGTDSSKRNAVRDSAPPDIYRVERSQRDVTPGFARVIKSKMISPYQAKTYLELQVGDIIRITQIKDEYGEGEVNGKNGRFPLTHVELIKPSDNA